jgi:hypothetical protein
MGTNPILRRWPNDSTIERPTGRHFGNSRLWIFPDPVADASALFHVGAET